jgi:hypothetical protein
MIIAHLSITALVYVESRGKAATLSCEADAEDDVDSDNNDDNDNDDEH